MKKINYFFFIFFILLAIGLLAGLIDNFSLNRIPEGILILSPFCALSSLACVKILSDNWGDC